MNDLVRTGKIRYIGVSNVTGWQLQKICDLVQRLNLETVVTLQTQYSLLSRGIELELTDVCENEGSAEKKQAELQTKVKYKQLAEILLKKWYL